MIPSLIVSATSLVLLVVLAQANLPLSHMAAAGATALVVAALAIAENRRLYRAGAARNAVAAAAAAQMAVVWLWGAAVLLTTYAFVLTWPEWWTYVAAFVTAGLVSIFFARQSARDEKAGRDDAMMQTLARRLTVALLVGMIVTMAGLLIDGKMTRYLVYRRGWEDWAANNIFFFGALALALIAANALWTSREKKP